MNLFDRIKALLKPQSVQLCVPPLATVVVTLSRSDLGDAIPGAGVTVTGPSPGGGSTDALGSVILAGRTPGTYTAAVTLPPAMSQFKLTQQTPNGSVGAGGVLILPFKATPTGNLAVQVRDHLGKPFVPAVTVSASGPESPSHQFGNGNHVFAGVLSGAYTVSIAAVPHHDLDNAKSTLQVQVPVGGTGTAIITLAQAPAIPLIELAAPKVVIVPRSYHGKPKPGVKPHRVSVKLRATGTPYDGEGELTCPSGDLRFFDREDGGTLLPLPVVVSNAELGGRTVYAEAVKPSSGMSTSELIYSLVRGSVPVNPPARDNCTCVKLTLKIFDSQPAGTAPTALTEAAQLDPGRPVVEQDSDTSRLFAERARLALMKAEPAAFTGKLVIEALGAQVEAFAAADEKPAAGQTALSGAALGAANPAIDAANGQIFWVQGKTVSGKVGDSGWKVGVEGVQFDGGLAEGDRVTMTVVRLALEWHKSRAQAQPGGVLPLMSKADKLDVGRFLHKQDTDFSHGRAGLLVKPVLPADFDGTLTLSQWNAGAGATDPFTRSGASDVRLFDVELAASGQAGASLPLELVHPANGLPAGKTYWVEAGATSAALRDRQLRLGIKNADQGADRVSTTLVEFTRIKATIKSTPANIARPGFAAPADHTFETTKGSEDFTVTLPLVLMRNAQPDIVLELTTVPAAPVDLPILWKAVRNPDDAAGLGSATDLPTVTPDGGDKRKATLEANNKGSFRIRPYIDGNGVDEYSPREPSIPLNLVLADVVSLTDNSAGINGNLTATGSAGVVSVRNGSWSAGTWAQTSTDDGGVNGAGMTMELVADVVGGGANGRLGLEKVFGGLVNMLTGNAIRLVYTDSTGGAPVSFTVSNLYVLNRSDATSAYGPTPMFKPGDPAEQVMLFPVLDTGRSPGGIGADTAVMGRSGVWDPAPVDKAPLGRTYTLRCIDSPGRGFLRAHPDHPNALLESIHYEQRFQANFCFWTNVTAVRSQTGDAADRVYSLARKMDWAVTADWTVNSTAATPVLTVVNPHVITVTNGATISPIGRAQDNGVEVRPPSGITTAIAWKTT